MREARSDSLYERLRQRGLLDLVIRQLYDGEKTPKEMVRFLSAEGVKTSQSSLYHMIKLHGLAYRLESAEEASRAMGLTGNATVDADEVLRRKVAVATFEADGLKELALLAKISGDSEKLRQAERKVQVLETRLRKEIYEAQFTAAEQMDAVLEEAEKLEAMRKEREAMKASNVSDRERVDAIRRRMYGDSAVMLERGAA